MKPALFTFAKNPSQKMASLRRENSLRLTEKVKKLETEVERLREENAKLREENAELNEDNTKLKEENAELRRRLGLNSTNSSKPPSSDSPSVRRSPRTPTERKPGKQEGTKGNRRSFLEPTEIVDHRPKTCRHCGAEIPSDASVTGSYQRRQQVEIPPIKPSVTEHRYHSICCPNCGKLARDEVKEEHKLCSGPRLSSLIAILTTMHNLTRRHIDDILRDVLGIGVSLGTVDNCVHEAGEAVKEPVSTLKDQLPQQEKLNIDETGWKKAGEKRWLWTFVAPNFTFFHIAKSRGKRVLKEFLGEPFPGIITSDRFSSYRSYLAAGWQICLAHLIREAKGLAQSDDSDVSCLGHWIRRELKLMIKLWKKGKSKSPEMNACKARLKRACLSGQDSGDKHVRNLARAILKYWEAVILFTRVEGISPTNNIAERNLRSLVIARKISFGNHSEKGLATTARLRTVVATARMRGVNVWDYLTHALAQHRSGQPVPLLDTS